MSKLCDLSLISPLMLQSCGKSRFRPDLSLKSLAETSSVVNANFQSSLNDSVQNGLFSSLEVLLHVKARSAVKTRNEVKKKVDFARKNCY